MFAGQMRERANAIALDDANADGHRLLAKIYLTQPRYDRALAEAERAIALNASDAESHGVRGAVLILVGRNDEAIQSLETEFRFDPTPKSASSFYLGLAYYIGRRHEAAVQLLEQAMVRYPEHPFTPAVLAAAYGQLGRDDEASRVAAALRRVNPFFDSASFGSSLQSPDSQAYLQDGLKKAGID
jgi:tetratricopeptide (TPR) repeat protein